VLVAEDNPVNQTGYLAKQVRPRELYAMLATVRPGVAA
jgi:hypothetical protein